MILLGLVIAVAIGNALVKWIDSARFRKIIEAILEQWTDLFAPRGASIPTLQLIDENIFTFTDKALGSRTSRFLARVFRLQPRTRDTIAWFIAYTTHPPALMCFISTTGITATLI